MAHERGNPPPVPKKTAPPPIPSSGKVTTISASKGREPIALAEAEPSSMEALAAITDGEWDIDEEVRTIQKTVATRPLGDVMRESTPPKANSVHTLRIPAPDELAPRGSLVPPPVVSASGGLTPAASVIGMVAASMSATSTPSIPPVSEGPASTASKPPPLPGRTTGKPPPPRKTVAMPKPVEPSRPAPRAVDPLSMASLVELLHARVASLGGSDDVVGLSRVHLELAITADVVLAEDARAFQHAETALKIDPHMTAAHAFLRRRKTGRPQLEAALAHLERELGAAVTDRAVADLLVERARMYEALGGHRVVDARAAWEQALARVPDHPGALKGLEAHLVDRALGGDERCWESLAIHLHAMAAAYTGDRSLGAWLHVERARILEQHCFRVEAARGSYERALDLDGRVGPVRQAVTRHVAAHDDAVALSLLLEQEADLETDPARAARLELDAATMCALRLHEPDRAIRLLERAAERAPTSPVVDRLVLDRLIELQEQRAAFDGAVQARRARLKLLPGTSAQAHELRALATLTEKLGDVEAAISDLQRVLSIEPGDLSLVERLDRLLKLLDRHEQRAALWVTESARVEDPERRARALLRAASIADEDLGRSADAVRHLRAAWLAVPGDAEIVDALARLLSPLPADESNQSEHRSLIELYTQAAQATKQPMRRVAYLEKVAVLWEEVMGEPRQALGVYQEILTLEPDRRGAILGLGRCAAKAQDPKLAARALLDEARVSDDTNAVLALRTRAAAALAKVDAPRALSLVMDVLERDPARADARALETQLHEEAQRWELAAASLRARIELAHTGPERASLWLTLAAVQEAHLRQPHEALASLQSARAADPTHPVPPDEIARALGAVGDHAGLRSALEQLAQTAPTSEERVRLLVRAAEIEESYLMDPEAAVRFYTRALTEMPEEELVIERLARALVRRASPSLGGPEATVALAGLGELASLLGKRLEHAEPSAGTSALAFTMASLLVDMGGEGPRAQALLEGLLASEPSHAPALRTFEMLTRRQNDAGLLARALGRQGEAFLDVRARLGALSALAALEEWKLPQADALPTSLRILEVDATDVPALETVVRREGLAARRGDARARLAMIEALRGLADQMSDESLRLALHLRLGLVLEASIQDATETASQDALGREAMARYREALRLDSLSVTAATGLARLSHRFGASEATVAAATALADLTVDPRARARYLLDAADVLLTVEDEPGLGSAEGRRARAAYLLERALDADPDSIPVAGRLSTLLLEMAETPRLLDTFRAALRRARAGDAVVMIGSEIARVAREELHDLSAATEAMRRVREAAPHHVPSLLTLAELCIAQRSWPDAVDALEAVVRISYDRGQDPAPRLTALFALASIYEKVLQKPDDHERVLRQAVATDASNARALQSLVRFLSNAAAHGREVQGGAVSQGELADLLTRLCHVEKDEGQKSALLIELGEIRATLGERQAAEQAFVEAVALDPHNVRAEQRLRTFFQGPVGVDPAAFARALGRIVQLGTERGHVDARWLAMLGHLEVDRLARVREGITHLQQAIQLDPSLVDTRVELAAALLKVSASNDAARVLLAMLTPSSSPLITLHNPGAALGLLERSFNNERRGEDALVVSELRAIAGDLDDGRHAWLRARRVGPLEPHHQPLDRMTLVTHVLPPEGRHILLEVAAAMTGIEAKVFRADLSELGISNRDRVSIRSGQSTRLLLDRAAKALGIGDVELVVAQTSTRTRILAMDVPWVVVPQSLTEQPEPTQLAALSRAVARIALGVPWLEELPPPHVEAFLIAAARQVVPEYGAQAIDVMSTKLVAQYQQAIARHLTRRHKKLLEELAPHIVAPQGAPLAPDLFVSSLSRAEIRVAYLITGDLLAALDELRSLDPTFLRATAAPGRSALVSVLEHPFAGDLCRFALTQEATALRRRIGSAWTG